MTEEQLRRLLDGAAGEAPMADPDDVLRIGRAKVKRRRLTAAATAVVLIAGGATAIALPGSKGPATHGPIRLAGALTSYTDCAHLLADLQQRSAADVGPYGFNTGGGFVHGGLAPTAAPLAGPAYGAQKQLRAAGDAPVAAPAASAPAGAATGGVATTTTSGASGAS
ncbi:MAG TPA: hypothetical protein VHE83_01420, partial [Mycobacteriales bacterium]|nr:hypothetical protein [Mycobacteriales bacterium]